MREESDIRPGLLRVLCLSAIATLAGHLLPLIGSAVMGMLLGMLWRWKQGVPDRCQPGVRYASQQLLQGSIIALGFSLPLGQIVQTGLHSLAVTLVTIGCALCSAYILGRLLGIPGKLCMLIGTGTAICGGSAIAAVIPVIRPEEHETAYALSTIFLFNIIAVLVFPVLGHWLGLSDTGFGLWAGTAINDTSSVVAAAYAWSREAGDHATIVKLARALMIIPLTLSLSLVNAARQESQTPGAIRVHIPWFIIGFVMASAIGHGLPPQVSILAHAAAQFLITAALCAIGLSLDLEKMRLTGWRPLILGMLVWISVAVSSLLVQRLNGYW